MGAFTFTASENVGRHAVCVCVCLAGAGASKPSATWVGTARQACVGNDTGTDTGTGPVVERRQVLVPMNIIGTHAWEYQKELRAGKGREGGKKGIHTCKKGKLSSPAIACASMVLPQPGGPCRRTPLGASTPKCLPRGR